jgi:hypothetical protein
MPLRRTNIAGDNPEEKTSQEEKSSKEDFKREAGEGGRERKDPD